MAPAFGRRAASQSPSLRFYRSLTFIFDKRPQHMKAAGSGSLAHLFWVRCIAEVIGDTLLRRVQSLSLYKTGNASRWDASIIQRITSRRVHCVNVPICIMVPHVCVFFTGAGLKRSHCDTSKGRAEQVLCMCSFFKCVCVPPTARQTDGGSDGGSRHRCGSGLR